MVIHRLRTQTEIDRCLPAHDPEQTLERRLGLAK
jgi:hypothetical protein